MEDKKDQFENGNDATKATEYSRYQNKMKRLNWEEKRKSFANGAVEMFFIKFGKHKSRCNDCGGSVVHLCENAYRKILNVLLDKAYHYGLEKQIKLIGKK